MYKGQGRNQCKLMTCVYQVFLVYDQEFQESIPITMQFEGSHDMSDMELTACISVARVRPRTSKGITDLLLPQTSLE